MKRSLIEMTSDWFGSSGHPGKNGSEMTVFERQQNQMKLIQRQHLNSTTETNHDQAPTSQGSKQTQSLTAAGDTGLQNKAMMFDHCLGWPEFGLISMPKEMIHSSFDCGNKYRLTTENPKKFIAEKYGAAETPKSDLEIIEENLKKRKMNSSKEVSKGNSRFSEVATPDYIQVRARRGQATDRHSLAERVRREKISQKMRFLQDLVPGCNKITGKTGMLDEIINYIQALQTQVEFLSMKLATATTAVNFNNGKVLAENPPKYLRVKKPDACSANFPLNQIQARTISETILHSFSTAQLSATSTPTWAHENLQDTASFSSITTWDADFQALPGTEFHQRKHYTFPSQPTEGDRTSMSKTFAMF